MPNKLSHVFETVEHRVLFVWIFILLVVVITFKRRTLSRKIIEPPCVGSLHWLLPKSWTDISSIWRFHTLLAEANAKYLSSNIPCFVPDFIFGRLLVLPPSYRKWMATQPDDVLDRHTTQREFVLPEDLAWHSKAPFDPSLLHGPAFQKFLASCLEASQDGVLEEIENEIRCVLNDKTDIWNELNMFETVESVVSRIAWNLIVGRPLCRQHSLIRYSKPLYLVILAFSLTVRLFPRFMRWPLLMIFRLPERYLYRRIKCILTPMIRSRMGKINEGARGHPGDYLTWAVQHERQIGAIQFNDEEIVDKICSMSIYLVFAITHGPTAVLSQAIICLLHSPRKEEYTAKLLAEMQLVSLQSRAANAEAVWTRDSISRLLMLDSTLRETMRLYPTSAVQPVWNVTKDTTLVASGLPFTLRRGTRVCLPAYTIHTDESLYPNSTLFDPFRFVARKTPLHKSNDAFLSWGAGRTACPGRQYASQTMKLVLVGFLMNYDFKTGNNGASEVGGMAEHGMVAALWLLQQGVDVNAVGKQGRTTLSIRPLKVGRMHNLRDHAKSLEEIGRRHARDTDHPWWPELGSLAMLGLATMEPQQRNFHGPGPLKGPAFCEEGALLVLASTDMALAPPSWFIRRGGGAQGHPRRS
ncbi:hypothetical protein NM208_g103 [Fusarium decemcellulare]|uniref:Uncharacterized protein n=1 Tax=Fusarium decemcellulare TaxID=57161 RepID=A0ACC1T0G6_9HYPO|nr:hypothetical protein NM208_g103 [Fusarium decemcellulare]